MKCSGCLKRESIHEMSDGYLLCDNCFSLFQKFYVCVICQKQLNPSVCSYNRRQVAASTCLEQECIKKNEVRMGRLCCEKAEYTNCVCYRSYKCPDHYPQGIHIGTHD